MGKRLVTTSVTIFFDVEELDEDTWNQEIDWGPSSSKIKHHRVAWSKLSLTKKLGGLGVKNMELMNKALIGKWIWRYGQEPNNFWRRVTDEKCRGYSSLWFPTDQTTSKHSCPWKSITKMMPSVQKHTKLEINRGMHLSFKLNKKKTTKLPARRLEQEGVFQKSIPNSLEGYQEEIRNYWRTLGWWLQWWLLEPPSLKTHSK